MHISYKPLWHTLLERDMRKEDLRLAAEDSYIHLFLFIYNLTKDVFATHARQPKH